MKMKKILVNYERTKPILRQPRHETRIRSVKGTSKADRNCRIRHVAAERRGAGK